MNHRLVTCCVLLLTLLAAGVAAASPLADGITLLGSKSFKEKSQGIDKIAESGDPKAEVMLTALLEGRLFFTKADQVLVSCRAAVAGCDGVEVLSGRELGQLAKKGLGRIAINNSLRGQLKSRLATLNLTSDDPAVRLAAVQTMYGDITADQSGLFADLLTREQDARVQQALTTALALAQLKSDDLDIRQAALAELAGNLDPSVRNALTALASQEQEVSIKNQLQRVLKGIDSQIAWYAKLETIFFGMSLGSVLVLAAIGLAITFGVIGVINMAHGELIMIGAYTAYVIQELLPGQIGLALALAVPAAFLVSALVGIVIERSVIRFLYGRPLETLLATFGISLILQQAVRTIFSPLNRSVATPDWMSGSIVINPVLSLTANRVTIFFFSLAVFGLLFLLMKKSSIGLQVRAVSQNRGMARAMGVRAARVDALTFGLGSGIAGIAGVALSQLTNVGPNLGQAYIVDSFMVVVFGGVGNLWGTLLGGLSLGVANKFLEPWSGAVLAKIIILVFIILFIQKRPQGLFPQRGRAAD
ncbi:MAG: urea ABC transporter permease subunit UrtB [Desulfopila sp.]